MEEIEIKVLNEQEDDVEIKPKTGFACGWGCTAGAVCIGGILCPLYKERRLPMERIRSPNKLRV